MQTLGHLIYYPHSPLNFIFSSLCQMLSLGLSYQESWSADFKTSPLLPVLVTLHVTNCHNTPLTVLVTANTTAGR